MPQSPDTDRSPEFQDSSRAAGDIHVIISYAHRDEKLRKELEIHLTTLAEIAPLKIWHDRKLGPGSDFVTEIDYRVETSHIFLLLVSPEYLASRYCYQGEMQYAIARHEMGLARVIPIILRPCDWRSTPMRRLVALPRDGMPVISWHRRDDAWLDVAKGVRRAVEELFPGTIALPEDIDRTYADSVANWDRWLTSTRDVNPEIAKLIRSGWAQEHFGGVAEPTVGTSYRGRRQTVTVTEWDRRYRRTIKDAGKQAHAKSPSLFD